MGAHAELPGPRHEGLVSSTLIYHQLFYGGLMSAPPLLINESLLKPDSPEEHNTDRPRVGVPSNRKAKMDFLSSGAGCCM